MVHIISVGIFSWHFSLLERAGSSYGICNIEET